MAERALALVIPTHKSQVAVMFSVERAMANAARCVVKQHNERCQRVLDVIKSWKSTDEGDDIGEDEDEDDIFEDEP